MDTIDIQALVKDLKELPALSRASYEEWREWCSLRGFGKGANGNFVPMPFAETATGLCTLRSYLRGRLHRQNPPQQIRDYNRAMLATERKHMRKRWHAMDWNHDIAHAFAKSYTTMAQALKAAAIEFANADTETVHVIANTDKVGLI